VYLGVVFLFVISGALAGTLIGGGLLFAASPYLSASLPVAFTPEWPWSAMARAFFVALMMGAAFVAAPVLRFSRVNPLSLFGATEDNSPPPPKRDWLTIGTIWTITILAIPLGWREKIAAAGILAAAAIIYGLSVAIAGASEPLARRCPPPFSWGLLAIARNRRQTAAGIVSFSIGMALLIGILNIESNFAARIDDTLRREAPTLYFIGIREEQEQALREAITDISPTARLRTIPFLRGRIVSIGGRAADTIEAPDNLRWILRGDRGLTWTIGGDYIGASQVSAGKLWNENIDAPQISFDAEAGEAFGMELGDTLELNILGRRWSGIVTSFRDIDWQSFDINFVIMMNQRPFGNAPYSLMGAAFLPPADETLVKLALAKQFPNVTPLSTGTAFELIKRLLRSISFLLQLSALFLLVSGIPVVVAALMDGQRRRADEATTLRLLGASTKTLALKGFTEFAAMAGVALLPALIFGLLASKLIVEFIFELKWQLSGGNPFIVVAAGIILFLIAGCLSVIHRMKQSPLALMRND
jgi:putative ABC transport system permease protein